MSLPIRGFENLILEENMPRRSTRLSSSQPGSGPSGEGPSSTDIIEAASGTIYSVRYNSNGRSRSRAEVGFHNVDVKLNQAIPQDENGAQYFAFEFTDQFSIRVGEPGSTHATPSCTCGANEDGIPCKHLYWFVDQVVRAEPSDDVVPVSADLVSVKNATLIELIHRLGFDRLVHSLPSVDGADLPPGSDELATIRQLREEVAATFKAFDSWVLFDGHTRDETLDVAACALRLEELVLSIQDACARPQWDVTSEAIATLLELANGVLDRNRDAHKIANAAWGLDDTAAPHADQDNNLYTRLMRHGPLLQSGASVFAALNEIGHDVLFVHEVEIKRLMQEVLTLGVAPAHRGELDRLRDRLGRGHKRSAESEDRGGKSTRGRTRR